MSIRATRIGRCASTTRSMPRMAHASSMVTTPSPRNRIAFSKWRSGLISTSRINHMAFDETHTTQPKTTYDQAIEAEKRRMIKEYQAPFLERITHCLHCQNSLTAVEVRGPTY